MVFEGGSEEAALAYERLDEVAGGSLGWAMPGALMEAVCFKMASSLVAKAFWLQMTYSGALGQKGVVV